MCVWEKSVNNAEVIQFDMYRKHKFIIYKKLKLYDSSLSIKKKSIFFSRRGNFFSGTLCTVSLR